MTATIQRVTLACFGLLLLSAGSGCNKKYSMNDQVEGSLKIDGAPMVGVVIDFVPQGAEAMPVSTGVTDTTGHFQLRCEGKKGAVVGKHKIVIHPGSAARPLTPNRSEGPRRPRFHPNPIHRYLPFTRLPTHRPWRWKSPRTSTPATMST